MKEILKYAAVNRIAITRNFFVKKSLEGKIVEDKVIKVVAIEVTEFVTKLIGNKNENNESVKRG